MLDHDLFQSVILFNSDFLKGVERLLYRLGCPSFYLSVIKFLPKQDHSYISAHSVSAFQN